MNENLDERISMIENEICQSVLRLGAVQKEILEQEGTEHSPYHHEMLDYYLSDYRNCDLDILKKKEREWSVNLNGKSYPIHRDDLINKELKTIGSRKRLYAGNSNKRRVVIFGDCREVELDEGHIILSFDEYEDAYTPIVDHRVPAYVPVAGKSAVRKNVCSYVVDAQWLQLVTEILCAEKQGYFPAFMYECDLRSKVTYLTAWYYMESLKRDCSDLFEKQLDSDYFEEASQIRDILTEDVRLHAELFCRGNRRLNDWLKNDFSGISKSLDIYIGIDVNAAVTEYFNNAYGAIPIILDRSTDEHKAAQMILTLLSDYWYFDDEKLKPSALIISACLASSLRNGQIDREFLNRAIDKFNEYLQTAYINFLEETKNCITTARHYINGNEVSSDLIEKQIDNYVLPPPSDASLPERELFFHSYKTAWWTNRVMLMTKLATDDFGQLLLKVVDFEKKVHQYVADCFYPEQTDGFDGKLDNLVINHIEKQIEIRRKNLSDAFLK